MSKPLLSRVQLLKLYSICLSKNLKTFDEIYNYVKPFGCWGNLTFRDIDNVVKALKK